MNDATAPNCDLFISYAAQDLPFVSALVHHLKDRRIRVWFDHGMLRVGDSFSHMVQEALEHSGYFLLVISPSYLKSAWGNFEMGVALSRSVSPTNGKIISLIMGDVNRDVLPPFIANTAQIVIGEKVNFDKIAEDLAAIIEQGEQRGRIIDGENLYSPSHTP